MALANVDWAVWRQEAAEFLRAHPAVRVRDLTRDERLLLPGAREAWALLTHQAAAHCRRYGGQPCSLCGEWTCAFCEGCQRPALPQAVCTECDRVHLLCRPCIAAGKVYSEVARDEGEAEGFLEVTGYHDEAGTFITLDPPLRFPTENLPRHADGTFNIDQLMEFVVSGQRPGGEAAADPGRRP